MKVFPYKDVKAEDAGEGSSKLKVRWLITKEAGAPNFAMRLFEMEPGGHSPLHKHPWEHEVFVLGGQGVVRCEGEDVKLKPGDAVFVPPDEKHQFKNNEKETLRFICLVPHKQK